MIQPHELFTGAILEYNIGTETEPKWAIIKLEWYDIRNISDDEIDFNKSYRPIPLTEQILVEWCGFENNGLECVLDSKFQWNNGVLKYTQGRNQTVFLPCTHLHLLQRLILALTNQPLKITLP